MRLVIVGLILVGVASSVAAKDKKPVDPDKKVCRSIAVTGSMLGRSECHTAADWAQIDDANRRAVRTFDDKKTTGGVRL